MAFFEKTSDFLSLFKISHESVRIYYHRFKKVLKTKKEEKLEKKLIFVWAAIDVDTKECLLFGLLNAMSLEFTFFERSS